MELKELIGIAGSPVVTALVQASKPFVRDVRYYPFIAIGYAVILNLVLAYILQSSLLNAAVVGVVAGLVSSGLFSALNAPTKPDPEN